MPLTTMKGMLREARREHRAIGAFNVANYEGAAAVVQAAEAEKSPVIIQVFQRLFTSNKAYDLAGMILRLAHRCTQPVAVHLDHGADVQQVKNALAWGYTSVMFDGSRLPFDENVKLTRFCADYAKTFGATCEGEILDTTGVSSLARTFAIVEAPPLPAIASRIPDAIPPLSILATFL